jgi:hypothetical protein
MVWLRRRISDAKYASCRATRARPVSALLGRTGRAESDEPDGVGLVKLGDGVP